MTTATTASPILYSFRRCPYAIRSRMAMAVSGRNAEIREILLRNKPEHMLDLGQAGTVPLLILPKQSETSFKVIEDSLDIMDWALEQHDPQQWLSRRQETSLCDLVSNNDGPFKLALDQYKYPSRFPSHESAGARERTLQYLPAIEDQLKQRSFISGDEAGFFDAAIFPFIRQWFAVDPKWTQSLNLTKLLNWHHAMINHACFTTVMAKLRPWQPGDSPIYLRDTLV